MEENNTKVSSFSKRAFWLILILALVALGISAELSVIFYKTNFLPEFQKSFCTISELIDCDGVALTKYSMSFGVPNALWGIFVYSILIFLLFVEKIQEKFKNTIFDVFKNPRSYVATISLLTFALSMILAFISIFKIHKICALCFCTYFLDLFIALVAQKGIISDIKTTIKDFIAGAKQYFVLFIVLLVAFISTLVYLDTTTILSPKLKKERLQKEFFEAKTNKYAVKGNILGKEDALVKVKIYTDFNCPFCKIFNIMIHKIAKKENILVEEYNFPLDNSCNYRISNTLGGHETSCFEAKVGLAAKKQNKFYDVANILYYNNFFDSSEIFDKIENSHIGIDISKLKSDTYSPEILEELQKEIDEAYGLGILGTPAIDIDGVLYIGGMPYDELEQKIKLAIKRKENN